MVLFKKEYFYFFVLNFAFTISFMIFFSLLFSPMMQDMLIMNSGKQMMLIKAWIVALTGIFSIKYSIIIPLAIITDAGIHNSLI